MSLRRAYRLNSTRNRLLTGHLEIWNGHRDDLPDVDRVVATDLWRTSQSMCHTGLGDRKQMSRVQVPCYGDRCAVCRRALCDDDVNAVQGCRQYSSAATIRRSDPLNSLIWPEYPQRIFSNFLSLSVFFCYFCDSYCDCAGPQGIITIFNCATVCYIALLRKLVDLRVSWRL